MPLVTPSVVVDMFDISGGWVPDASQFSLQANELLTAENVELDYRGGFRVRAGYDLVANTGSTFHHLGIFTEDDYTHNLIAITSAGDIWRGTSTTMSDTLQNLAAYTIGADPDREYDVSFVQLRDYLYVSSLRGNTWRFDGTTWLEITDSTLNGAGDDGTPEFPQAKATLTLHNRAFAGNVYHDGAAYPSRVRWSTLTAGADQYGGNRWEATSFIDVQEKDGSQIQALHAFQSNIIVFKDNAIYTIAGDDEDNFSLFPNDETVGTTVSGSIASDESVLFFLDPRSGVYMFDGVRAQRIDEQINNTLMAIIKGFGETKLFAKGWIEDSKYFLCVGQMDGNKETFVFDMRYQAWVHWDLAWADIISYRDTTYHVGNDGLSTFRNRTYLDDDGTTVTWQVQTAWIPPAADQDMRQYRLRRFDIHSQYVTGGSAGYTFKIFADNDDSTPIYTQTPDGDEATERMPGYDGLVFRAMFEFTGTNSAATQTDRRITGLSIKMSARPSKGSYGAGLQGPAVITDTRNYPGSYWRAINWTHNEEASANMIEKPTGGVNGDYLFIAVGRGSAWEPLSTVFAADGFTRIVWNGASAGDPRSAAVYYKKVTDWSSEPATYTGTDDTHGYFEDITCLIIRGLAGTPAVSGASSLGTYLQTGVTAPSVAADPHDFVLFYVSGEQHTIGLIPADVTDLEHIVSPGPDHETRPGADLWIGDQRAVETDTTWFIWDDALVGGFPEYVAITVVAGI